MPMRDLHARVRDWAARETVAVHELNDEQGLEWDGLIIVTEVMGRFKKALETWPEPPADSTRKALIATCERSALRANRRCFAESSARL